MKAYAALGLILSLGIVSGCGEDAPPPPPQAPTEPPPGGAPPPQQAAGGQKKDAKAAEPADLPPLPTPDIQERDFLESPANRDPFKSYADLFMVKPVATEVKVQREILIQKHSLEELKIVGIVTGSAGRVLVQDPEGLGWVLRVGDFVGKSEVVRSGGAGGGDVAVNWRLDRIRENDVVFVRELPDPSAPATTRVLSLRTQDELKQEIRTGIRGTRPDEKGEPEEPKTPRKKGS
ncbi:MAG: pilus assembly protein PilP [Polyangiaceae bacterium]|nr:pilus assembly protein PilP [Polyangiaceae bacterium]